MRARASQRASERTAVGFWVREFSRRGDSLVVEVLLRIGAEVKIDLVEPQRRDAPDEAELQDEQHDVRVEEPAEEPVNVEAALEHLCSGERRIRALRAGVRANATAVRTSSVTPQLAHATTVESGSEKKVSVNSPEPTETVW